MTTVNLDQDTACNVVISTATPADGMALPIAPLPPPLLAQGSEVTYTGMTTRLRGIAPSVEMSTGNDAATLTTLPPSTSPLSLLLSAAEMCSTHAAGTSVEPLITYDSNVALRPAHAVTATASHVSGDMRDISLTGIIPSSQVDVPEYTSAPASVEYAQHMAPVSATWPSTYNTSQCVLQSQTRSNDSSSDASVACTPTSARGSRRAHSTRASSVMKVDINALMAQQNQVLLAALQGEHAERERRDKLQQAERDKRDQQLQEERKHQQVERDKYEQQLYKARKQMQQEMHEERRQQQEERNRRDTQQQELLMQHAEQLHKFIQQSSQQLTQQAQAARVFTEQLLHSRTQQTTDLLQQSQSVTEKLLIHLQHIQAPSRAADVQQPASSSSHVLSAQDISLFDPLATQPSATADSHLSALNLSDVTHISLAVANDYMTSVPQQPSFFPDTPQATSDIVPTTVVQSPPVSSAADQVIFTEQQSTITGSSSFDGLSQPSVPTFTSVSTSVDQTTITQAISGMQVTSSIQPAPVTSQAPAIVSAVAPTVQPTVPTVVIRQQVPVKPYNDTTSWKSFRDHFSRVCTINGWQSQTDQVQHLTVFLEGPAAEVLKGIDEHAPNAWDKIWQALRRRFGNYDDAREAMHKFDTCKQTDTMSLPEFEQF